MELLRSIGTSEIGMSGYRQSPEPWMQIAKQSMFNKLLPEDRIRAGRDTGLQECAEDGAAQRVTLVIQKSILTPNEYANIIVATREVIFNQGSNNFVSAVREEGASAALTIGNEFIRQLTTNADMLDDNPLFHTSHNNIDQSPGLMLLADLDCASLGLMPGSWKWKNGVTSNRLLMMMRNMQLRYQNLCRRQVMSVGIKITATARSVFFLIEL